MPRLISLLAVLIAASAGATEPNSEEQLLGFISDASVFEGQFYSVHDYCSPYAGEPISTLSLKSWYATNKQLLRDRDQIVEELIRDKDLNTKEANNLRQAVRGFIATARSKNRLYKDLINKSDKPIQCSKRLGAMNSPSMSFENIAPASYTVWQKYHGE